MEVHFEYYLAPLRVLFGSIFAGSTTLQTLLILELQYYRCNTLNYLHSNISPHTMKNMIQPTRQL